MPEPSSTQTHAQPTSRAEFLAAWRSLPSIQVPTASGKPMTMNIIHLIEATAVDGIPVDLVVEARAGKRGPVRRFAVVFSDTRPAADYPIPTLWMGDGESRWLAV